MAFTEAWVESDPDGGIITVSLLDNFQRASKRQIRERLEGDPANPFFSGVFESSGGGFATTSVVKKGVARTFVDLAANIGSYPLQDGRLFIASDTGRMYHLKETGAVELPYLTAAGGTISGDIILSATTADRQIILTTSAGQARNLIFRTGANNRWVIQTNSAAEAGANAGSNLSILRYNDAGGLLGTSLTISRASGQVTLEGDLVLTNPGMSKYVILQGDAAFEKGLVLRTGTANRWHIMSNNTAESGSNAGSNFDIRRYDDAGTLIDTAFRITRSSGMVTIFNGLVVSANGVAITGGAAVAGGLTVSSGGAAITGNSTVTGNITATGALNGATLSVTGAVALSGGATISGSPLTVSGVVAIFGSGIEGPASGPITATHGMVVTAGGININAGGLSVTGAAAFGTGITVGGGLTVSSGDLTVGSGDITISRGANSSLLTLSSNAGQYRLIRLGTALVQRWELGADSTAEGGANAGSNFNLWNFSDAGANLGPVLTVTRSSGQVRIHKDLVMDGVVSATAGYQQNGVAPSGQYLRGNGTNFVASAIQVSDMPAGDRVMAYRTADLNITVNNTFEAVSWDAEEFDSTSMHDNSTNPSRITIQNSGRYLVIAQIGWGASSLSTRAFDMEIRKNGSGTAIDGKGGLLVSTTILNVQHENITRVLDLTAGDYLEVFVKINDATLNPDILGSSSIGYPPSFFQVIRLY